MTDLRHRLTALLDVLQQCHAINRSTAARIVSTHIGRSHTHILNIASGQFRPQATEFGEPGTLALLEIRYATPLKKLKAYRFACQKVAA